MQNGELPDHAAARHAMRATICCLYPPPDGPARDDEIPDTFEFFCETVDALAAAGGGDRVRNAVRLAVLDFEEDRG